MDADQDERPHRASGPTGRRVGHHVLVLTHQALEESEDVLYLVVDELIRLVNAVPIDKQASYVRTLSTGMRMVWGVFMVDGEVNNGGFNQFFWNSSCEYVNEARDGFRLIGAFEHARLVDEAVERFDQHAQTLRPYYERGTIEAFSESYKENTFTDLDDRYFELDSAPLQISYIRANPDEFTTD